MGSEIEITREDRELLAYELEADGLHLEAELVRYPIDGLLHLPALRAIAKVRISARTARNDALDEAKAALENHMPFHDIEATARAVRLIKSLKTKDEQHDG